MVTVNVAPVGAFLRQQSRGAQQSLRHLAGQSGAPGAYLGQLERGLRKPSAEALAQLARGLRVSAEQLSTQAGLLGDRPADELAVESALRADSHLSERHKRVLIELYQSFRVESASVAAVAEEEPTDPGAAPRS